MDDMLDGNTAALERYLHEQDQPEAQERDPMDLAKDDINDFIEDGDYKSAILLTALSATEREKRRWKK
jgi:hypothetical protein